MDIIIQSNRVLKLDLGQHFEIESRYFPEEHTLMVLIADSASARLL
jgi:hypothetical protein